MSRLKSEIDFTEKRLKDDCIKLIDEAISKLNHCKSLINMDLLPLTLGDTGIREMQALNNILFTISKYREINYKLQMEKQHARKNRQLNAKK